MFVPETSEGGHPHILGLAQTLRNQPCQLLRFCFVREPGEERRESLGDLEAIGPRARLCDGQPCLFYCPLCALGSRSGRVSLVEASGLPGTLHPIPSTQTQCGRLPGQMVSSNCFKGCQGSPDPMKDASMTWGLEDCRDVIVDGPGNPPCPSAHSRASQHLKPWH